jgi:WD40 repeat protein
LKQAVTDGLQNDNVYTLACEDGGNRLISANSKANVTVWETDPLRPKTSVINYTDGELTVWSLAIAASPLSVLSGNSNGRVYRWIPDDPEWTGSNKKDDKIRTSDTDAKVNRTINSISHNQKYGWIAAGGAGQSVEIYNMNLQKIRSLTGHDGTVWFVSFDPQGSRLAYGGLDRILRVFDVDEMQRLDREQPKKLYQESQKTTGLSVVDGKMIVGTPAR